MTLLTLLLSACDSEGPKSEGTSFVGECPTTDSNDVATIATGFVEASKGLNFQNEKKLIQCYAAALAQDPARLAELLSTQQVVLDGVSMDSPDKPIHVRLTASEDLTYDAIVIFLDNNNARDAIAVYEAYKKSAGEKLGHLNSRLLGKVNSPQNPCIEFKRYFNQRNGIVQ